MSQRVVALVVLAGAAFGCADVITDLVDYAAIEVEATRLSGEPVPGAEFTLHVWPPRELAAGTTNRNGRFVFDYVPPENGYAVHGKPPEGYVRPEFLYGGPSSEWVSGLYLGPGDRSSVEFKFLKVGPGSIEVRVERPDGSPVMGARLAAYTFKGEVHYGITDPAGRHVFGEIPFGLWGVQAIPPQEYAFGGEDVQYRDGLVIEDGVRRQARFVMDLSTLQRCDGAILVRVSDQDGAPVQGYPVYLYDHTGPLRTATTDVEGRHYFTRILCGGYGVALERLRGFLLVDGRSTSYVDGLAIQPETPPIILDFAVERCSGSIRVDVVDTEGQPLRSARVHLYTARGSVESRTTGPDGSVTFGLITCGEAHGVRLDQLPGYAVQGEGYADGLVVEDGATAQVVFRLEVSESLTGGGSQG